MKNHEKFMGVALKYAAAALENNEFPVGCVIVGKNGEIISTGARVNSNIEVNEMDHAEIIALRKMLNCEGIKPEDVTVYSTLEPCLMCFATLIINGIRKIIYSYEDALGGGTDLSLSSLKPLYQSMNIEIIPGILREESHALFVKFFSNPENKYLSNTLLPKYILAECKNIK